MPYAVIAVIAFEYCRKAGTFELGTLNVTETFGPLSDKICSYFSTTFFALSKSVLFPVITIVEKAGRYMNLTVGYIVVTNF